MIRPRDLLVLDFDGVAVAGAVVRVDRHGTVAILRRAASTAAAPEAALDEVLGALGRTPASCIVRSVEAVAGLFRLPIAPRGRARDELAQMLRWELEPLYAQQAAARPLGAILEVRGHLDRARTERILAVMREQGSDGETRFGAVARELGYVTDAQLAEAVAIQERMGRADEERVCGWTLQPAPSGSEGGTLWLAAGMPAARRRWWAEQLRARGLRLRAIYPRLPAATAALDPGADATVVEVEPHAVARSVVRKGALVSLEILLTSDAEPPAAVCRELLEGTDPAETFVAGALVATVPAAVPLPSPVRGAGGGAAWAGLAGVARHATGRGGPCAAIPARDPARPLLRRPAVRWAAVIALALAAAWGVDRLAARSLSRSVRELADARERLDRVTREIGEVDRQGAEAAALAKEIGSLEAERDTLRDRLRMLAEDAAARSRLLPALLDALSASVNDDMLLDRTTEESPGRIRVEGRALSERSVQAFGRAVAARVAPLGLRIVDQAIRKAPSRSPYSFSFLLEPRPGGEDA